ncbi:MAG: hypothetical protein WCD42_08045 [Rhizomicrobium sp.]
MVSVSHSTVDAFCGTWCGQTSIFGKVVHFSFYVGLSEDGFAATFDCREPGFVGMAVRQTSFQRNVVYFDLGSFETSFRGVLSPLGDEISGFISQGAYRFALTLNRPVETSRPAANSADLLQNGTAFDSDMQEYKQRAFSV